MDGNYLIPANSKKSALILGMFRWVDLFIFGTGVLITFILMMAGLPNQGFTWVIVTMLPGGIALLLVFPVPNYHNVITGLISVYKYFTNPSKYIWNGWCIDENDDFQ